MSDAATTSAIAAALKCDWATAVSVNAKILKDHPTDIDCLNRLGKAHLEMGDCKKAATYFRKALKIDKYNAIAQKNLARSVNSKPNKQSFSLNKQSFSNKKPGATASYTNFIEEPGKTRLVTLVNTAPAATLMGLDHADALVLVPKRHTVIIEDGEGQYLGALPDDLGHRLGVLIKGGNRYEAITKSITKNSIVVFLRETFRSKKFHNTPSFLSTTSPDYLSFLREDTTQDLAKTAPIETEDTDEMAIPNHHEEEEGETT